MDTQTLKNDLSWLQKHERLLIVIFVLTTLLLLGNKWINYQAEHDKVTAVASQQLLDEQKSQNAKLASEIALDRAHYDSEVKMWQEQNQRLVAAVNASNEALKKQQSVNQTLPLPDLAIRWKTLVPLQDSDIATTPTGVSVSDTGARETVNQLERVPVLQSNVNDLTVLNSNKDSQINELTGLNGKLNQQIGGLNSEISKADKACENKIDVINANARKSKRNWFIVGTIFGGLAKTIAKVALGL